MKTGWFILVRKWKLYLGTSPIQTFLSLCLNKYIIELHKSVYLSVCDLICLFICSHFFKGILCQMVKEDALSNKVLRKFSTEEKKKRILIEALSQN